MSESKSLEYPDVEISFKGFGVQHSWYKHIIGEESFILVPVRNYPYQYSEPESTVDAQYQIYWYMIRESSLKAPERFLSPLMKQSLKTVSDLDLQKVILNNKVRVTPFVYTENHGFHLTIGGWGWTMFDWLEEHGYTDEAKAIKEETGEFESGGIYYKGSHDHNTAEAKGPVADVFRKEQERILGEMRTAAANIWKQMKEMINSRTLLYNKLINHLVVITWFFIV